MIYLMGKELNLKECFDIMNQLDEDLCENCLNSNKKCKNEYCQRYEEEFDIRMELIHNGIKLSEENLLELLESEENK